MLMKIAPASFRSKTECTNPKLRLLCFTNAGNEENVYTNEGIGARRFEKRGKGSAMPRAVEALTCAAICLSCANSG